MYIKRLSTIEDIIAIQNKIATENKTVIQNISNWTVSEDFKQNMNKYYRFNTGHSIIDYIYSYNISEIKKDLILSKLGVPINYIPELTLYIFPNNTISIINIINFLKRKNIKKIGIIEPSYFSVKQVISSFNLDYDILSTKRKNKQYYLPDITNIVNKNFDALWITSPVYSTGSLYANSEIDKLKKILEMGIAIIADESFATHGKELIRDLYSYENFFSIYSPHKSLSFNSLKFSVIVSQNMHEDLIDQWSDVLSGNLPHSTVMAVDHFLSDNFEECSYAYEIYIENCKSRIYALLSKFPFVDYDTFISGNLMTLYFKNLTFKDSISLDYLKNIITQTYVSFYPGYLNGFSEEMGFCFRINMTLYSAQFESSLYRILNFLHNNNLT